MTLINTDNTLKDNGIKETAKFCREYYGNDLIKILKELDILLKEDILGESNPGYLISIQSLNIITLSNSLNDWKKELILAHELGHFILHQDTYNPISEDYKLHVNDSVLEHEATDFALRYIGLDKFFSEDNLDAEKLKFIMEISSPKRKIKTVSINSNKSSHIENYILCGDFVNEKDIELLSKSIENTIDFVSSILI